MYQALRQDLRDLFKDPIFWGFTGFTAVGVFSCMLCFGLFDWGCGDVSWVAERKFVKQIAFEHILKSTRFDAINFADTINLADYETTFKLKAKCDSLYYARKMRNFIDDKGDDFMRYHPRGGYIAIDQDVMYKDPKFNKYLTGYKKSVRQLAVLRRTNNQRKQ